MKFLPIGFLLALSSGCSSTHVLADGGVFHELPDGGALFGLPDGGSVSDGSCAGLDVISCRARSECAADFCTACSCTPSFKGCRAVRASAFECPTLDCVSKKCCSKQSDCSSSESCDSEVQPVNRCGNCDSAPGDCVNDSDCSPASTGRVCQPIQCACLNTKLCVPGCTKDSECDSSRTCNVSSHRCEPAACSATQPCVANFDCVLGHCARRTCTSDAVCDGFCVDNLCAASRGVCMPPVP